MQREQEHQALDTMVQTDFINHLYLEKRTMSLWTLVNLQSDLGKCVCVCVWGWEKVNKPQ